MNADPIRIVLSDDVEESELLTLADRNKWFNVNRIAEDGVKGKDAERIVAILQGELQHYSSETILELIRDPSVVGNDRRAALYYLALDKMEHGFDQETFDIFKQAMADKDPIVRGAAVTGSIYLGWKQLAVPMKALATDKEPDESIRQDAALLSGRLEQLK